MEVERKQPRRRVNVTISTKGVRTYDCTIDTGETESYTEDEVLAMSDSLVAKLDKRYPPIKE